MPHARIVPALILSLLLVEAARSQDDIRPERLFNGQDLTGWKAFLKDGTTSPDPAFVVRDGEIQISGEPRGFLYTDRPFSGYVLSYSWRFPKEQPEKTTINTGLLIHIQQPDKVWPKSVEPQGRYQDHGKLYFPGFPKEEPRESAFDEAAQKQALKPADEWNTTEVTAGADGSIEVRVNGRLVSTGKTSLTSGPIGFQSEGAAVRLKDITLRKRD